MDDQLKKRSGVLLGRVVLVDALCHPRGPSSAGDFPAGTITEIVAADGSVVHPCVVPSGTTVPTASPVLPKSLPSVGESTPYQPFTVDGTGGVSHYRMTD